jgi:hypothetical protein
MSRIVSVTPRIKHTMRVSPILLQDNMRDCALDCQIHYVLREHPQGYGPPDDPD